MKKKAFVLGVMMLMLLLSSCQIPPKEMNNSEISVDISIEDSSSDNMSYEQIAPVVTDAYSNFFADAISHEVCCYHIPQIELPDQTADRINSEMYDSMYAFLEENECFGAGEPFIGSLAYGWGVKDDIISIITAAPDVWGGTEFEVYNVSVTTGERLDDTKLFEKFGIGSDAFSECVKTALGEKYDRIYEQAHASNKDNFSFMQMYRECRNKTIADSNVAAAVPFIGEDGELCVVAKIHSLAGAEEYCYLVSVTGATDPEIPKCEIDHIAEQRPVDKDEEASMFVYEVAGQGKIRITGYTQEPKGELVIPAQIAGNEVAEIGMGAFAYCLEIERLVLPHQVETIGAEAFLNCSKLTEVYLPASLVEIGVNAFEMCEGMKTVYFSGSMAEYKKLGNFGNDSISETNVILHCNAQWSNGM